MKNITPLNEWVVGGMYMMPPIPPSDKGTLRKVYSWLMRTADRFIRWLNGEKWYVIGMDMPRYTSDFLVCTTNIAVFGGDPKYGVFDSYEKAERYFFWCIDNSDVPHSYSILVLDEDAPRVQYYLEDKR